jgi:hypothetical protein
MSNVKKKSIGINSSVEARNVAELSARTSNNVYEALAIISRRADQIALDVKEELHSKLEEFASVTDNLEEVHENKEQIEISKFYERLPNPALIALNEFMNDNVYWRFAEQEKPLRREGDQ